MATVTYTYERDGRDMVFCVDGHEFRAGAATTRCFRDIQSQFFPDEALATVEAAVRLQRRARKKWPDARGPRLKAGEHAVLGEALLLAGGVPEDKVEELCRGGGYRNNGAGSYWLRDYGFNPPLPAILRHAA
jgi:hypothetical protein